MPHADEAWRKTLEEVDAGTLVGSIKLNDVPDDYPLSKRFGIQQGQKIRCIDDFTRSSTNSCVQTCESPKLHTLDVFGALCVMAMASTGERRKWKGWTFDLVGAYRQCAVRPASRRYARIAVPHPISQKIFFSLWFLLVKE